MFHCSKGVDDTRHVANHSVCLPVVSPGSVTAHEAEPPCVFSCDTSGCTLHEGKHAVCSVCEAVTLDMKENRVVPSTVRSQAVSPEPGEHAVCSCVKSGVTTGTGRSHCVCPAVIRHVGKALSCSVVEVLSSHQTWRNTMGFTLLY